MLETSIGYKNNRKNIVEIQETCIKINIWDLKNSN